MSWISTSRLRLGIAALGVLLSAAPVVGSYLLATSTIRANGQSLVDEIAAEIVAHADRAIGTAIAALQKLAASGVDGCDRSDLLLMREVAHASYLITDVGIADGDALACNHLGEPLQVRPQSRSYAAGPAAARMELIQTAESSDVFLMVSLELASGSRLVAILPAPLLAIDLVPTRLRETGLGVLRLNDGTLIGTVPAAGAARVMEPFGDDAITANIASAFYPVQFSLLVPYSVFIDANAGLIRGTVAAGALATLLILALTVSVVLRGPGQAREMRAALRRGEFVPFYQPVIDLAEGRLAGAEALVRWRKADGTIVAPATFIGLAEATGLALPMTRMLMERIAADLGAFYALRPALKVAVNLFADHFETLDTVRDVKAVFEGSGIRFSQLVFEITERQQLNIQKAKTVIRGLQEIGAAVALDDTGTGHGGLAYLQQLGVDCIKIDKLFTDTIGTDRISAPIVDSLITLGHDLGMNVVAEGVENFEQVEYLRRRGVALAQGYLFAPPLPAKSFLELIEAGDRRVPDGELGGNGVASEAQKRISRLVA